MSGYFDSDDEELMKWTADGPTVRRGGDPRAASWRTWGQPEVRLPAFKDSSSSLVMASRGAATVGSQGRKPLVSEPESKSGAP
jgi:hypothetical protein